MPIIKHKFALRPDQPAHITVEYSQHSFTGTLSNLLVSYKDRPIGKAQTEQEIRRGITINLARENYLRVQVIYKDRRDVIKLFLNDQPLGESRTQREETVRIASYAFIFVGIMNIALSAFALQMPVESMFGYRQSLALLHIGVGVLYIVLSMGMRTFNSVGFGSLIIGLGIYAVESILIILTLPSLLGVGGFILFLRLGLFFVLAQCVPVSWRLAHEPNAVSRKQD